MRSALAGTLGALALAGALSACSAETPTPTHASALESAGFGLLHRDAGPEPRFSRTTVAATTMPGSGVMLDLCQGPVAIDLGEKYPTLLAEHDYCGGSAWMPKLAVGEAVALDGDGVEAGTYVVTSVGHAPRGTARYSDLPVGDVVLQTCVSKTQIVLVGLERHRTVVQG